MKRYEYEFLKVLLWLSNDCYLNSLSWDPCFSFNLHVTMLYVIFDWFSHIYIYMLELIPYIYRLLHIEFICTEHGFLIWDAWWTSENL